MHEGLNELSAHRSGRFYVCVCYVEYMIRKIIDEK